MEPRHREAPRRRRRCPRGAEPHVSLVDWLEADGDELRAALRAAVRPAERRRATCAATRSSRSATPAAPEHRAARVERSSTTTTSCCASTPHGRCAPDRRSAADGRRRAPRQTRALDRVVRLAIGAVRGRSRSPLATGLPAAATETAAWLDDGRASPLGAVVLLVARAPRPVARAPACASRRGRARLRHRDRLPRYAASATASRPGTPVATARLPAVDRGGAPLRHASAASGRRARDARRSSSWSSALRAAHSSRTTFQVDVVTFQLGIEAADSALIVGWLVAACAPRARARPRPARREAEELRDELGRRADLLEAANRCARALALVARPRGGVRRLHPRAARASSPFDRVAIVLAERRARRA